MFITPWCNLKAILISSVPSRACLAVAWLDTDKISMFKGKSDRLLICIAYIFSVLIATPTDWRQEVREAISPNFYLTLFPIVSKSHWRPFSWIANSDAHSVETTHVKQRHAVSAEHVCLAHFTRIHSNKLY